MSHISDTMLKYVTLRKLHTELTNCKDVLKDLAFDPNPTETKKNKQLRDSVISLIQLSPQKRDINKFYDDLSASWYESNSHLWNYTFNPDLGKVTTKKRGYYPDLLVKRYCRKLILSIVNSKNISFAIEEVVIYWEWGDKNKKFHCNICIRADIGEDARYQHFITDKLRSKGQCVLKDQKKMPKYDYYNIKDAAFMSKCGHPPIHLVNKSKMMFQDSQVKDI